MKPVAHRGLGRQLVLNSFAIGVYNLVYLVIGLWYARYLVNTLGIAMQAVVPVAASFVAYIQFATTTVSGSVGRFVLADIARGDPAAANRTFNTFLVATQRISLLLLVGVAAIVWFVVPHLDYPPGYLNTTRFVFAAILLSAIIQTWSMCFDCAIWISGRIDVRNWILVVELVLRNGTVFLLFTLDQPNLGYIGVGCLIAPLASLALYILVWKKFTPELTINSTLYDKARFREIKNVGGWSVVMQLGSMLLFNADMILLNVLLGRQIQGSYGLLLMWSNIFRGLFVGLSQMVSPSIIALQANGENEKLVDLAIKSVRTQGLLMSIPVGVLCGLAAPALNWWMGAKGPEITFLAPLAWVILVPLVIEGAFLPSVIIIQLPSIIAYPAIVTLILGVVNVILGIGLVKFTNMGMYGMAAAVAITSLLRHAILLPIYAAKIMRQPWYVLIQQFAQVIIQFAITSIIAFYFSQFLTTRSLPQLLLAASAAGGIATGLALLQLSRDERTRLMAMILRR